MEEDELVDGDFYLLAKSYFDCREYKRAAHVLRDQNGRKSVFLRCHALYLVSFVSPLLLWIEFAFSSVGFYVLM